MNKGKTVVMKTITMKKNITIKANLINTKEEDILRRRVFTIERTITCLKKVMDMFMILAKKNSSSWPCIQSLLIWKMKTIIKKNQIKKKKKKTLMGK
jgi:hypothetical protein